MMIQLLKKDWRVNRAPLVGAIAVFSAIYLITTVELLIEHFPTDNLQTGNGTFLLYHNASNVGLCVAMLISAAFGGVAFTVERRERSADFLAVLPVTRAQIILSKTIIGVGASATLWAFNVGVGYVALSAMGMANLRQFYDEEVNHVLVVTAIFLVMVFGLAWLLSTFLPSPTFACIIALGIGIGSNYGIGIWADHKHFGPYQTWLMEWFFCVWSVGIGIISYILGTIYYLRRVAP